MADTSTKAILEKENVRLANKIRKLKREKRELEAELAIYRAQDRFHNNVRGALRKVRGK